VGARRRRPHSSRLGRALARPTCDVLILAAFDPELAPLRAALGDSLRGRFGGQVVEARKTGVGLPAAAIGATLHITEIAPRAVVLIGTCGAYAQAGLAVGDVVAADTLRLVDPASLDGATEFPEPMAVAAKAHGPLAAALAGAGARPSCVATTLAITVDDAVAEKIARGSGADVEHLEAHGVAMACAARGVPFGAVLGVANPVGASGRAAWRAHHREAEAAAAECVLRWLAGGGLA
jgi:nucleoside phosphorylase